MTTDKMVERVLESRAFQRLNQTLCKRDKHDEYIGNGSSIDKKGAYIRIYVDPKRPQLSERLATAIPKNIRFEQNTWVRIEIKNIGNLEF